MNLFNQNSKLIVGSILSWINERKSLADPQNIKEAILVLLTIAKSNRRGKTLLNKYGSKEFFLEFRKNAKEDLYEDIDQLLTLLVQEVEDEEDKENNSIIMNTNMFQADEYSEKGITTDDEYRFTKVKERESFMQDTINDRNLDTKFGMSFTNSIYEPSKSSIKQKEDFNDNKKFAEDIPKLFEKKTKPTLLESMKTSQDTHRTFIQLEKKPCELPIISLTESDENYLMDCGVKLKYGDAKSFSEISRSLESHLFNDYPLETYLQRTEILDGALDVLVQTVDIRTFNNCVCLLSKFIDCVKDWRDFIINPYNIHPDCMNYDQESKQEHIESMYPARGSKKWEEIKFILCNIAVECLYSCQNEEKIGPALTVYRNVIKTLNHLYSNHIEKCEDVIIKILNGFDNVLSYLNTLNIEDPVRAILLDSVSAIKLSNKIFFSENYNENSEKYHPKTKLLISATCKLQQELRKALFNCVFEQQDCAQPIIDFFKLKW